MFSFWFFPSLPVIPFEDRCQRTPKKPLEAWPLEGPNSHLQTQGLWIILEDYGLISSVDTNGRFAGMKHVLKSSSLVVLV